MPLHFRTFRQAVCLLISLSSGVSLCFGIYLFKFFFRRGLVWLLISVEISSCLRSTWSGVRKPLFATPQSVASEAVGLFILFPFQLIIVLLLTSIVPRPSMPPTIFMFLRIFSVTGALIHMTYTVGLVAIAMLTVPSFDADVWLRDLDSSPSPFPLPIIFAHTFPWVARHFEATRVFVEGLQVTEDSHITCLPTCPPNCTTHEERPLGLPKPLDPSAEGSKSDDNKDTFTGKMVEIKRPPILPHTLIRIPNAAERRSSIYVDLEFSPGN